nr:hypothetical protein [Lachnospiraceae bacterium]
SSEAYFASADRDEDWNTVLDAQGNPVMTYRHGNEVIPAQEYQAAINARDEMKLYAISETAEGMETPLLDYMSREDLLAAIASGRYR